MKFCIQCGTQFEQKTDKYRKHCYNCVPFGARIRQPGNEGDHTCTVCGRLYFYNRKKGNTRIKCGNCSVNQRKNLIKARALEYKGGQCQLCGYSRCTRAMVFHHIDDSTKEFQIGGSHGRKWETIQAELDKCALLCTNCHAEVHEGLVDLNAT